MAAHSLTLFDTNGFPPDCWIKSLGRPRGVGEGLLVDGEAFLGGLLRFLGFLQCSSLTTLFLGGEEGWVLSVSVLSVPEGAVWLFRKAGGGFGLEALRRFCLNLIRTRSDSVTLSSSSPLNAISVGSVAASSGSPSMTAEPLAFCHF